MNDESEFAYTRHGLTGGPRWQQRMLEIVPGATSVSILGGLAALSWFRPVWALLLIVAIDLLWLFYLCFTLILLAVSSCRLAIERHTDWIARIRALDNLQSDGGAPQNQSTNNGLGRRLSEWIHQRGIQKLRARGESIPRSDTVHHVVILPVATESQEMLDLSLHSLLDQSFPPERTMVILAIEENAKRRVKEGAWELHRKYYESFLALYVAPHHTDSESPEEIHRTANVTYAAKMAAQALQERHIPLNCAIVTCLDPCAVLGPQYLACVAWHFMACPSRDRVSFQPVPLFHLNVWNAPALARVLHIGSSFFHMIEASDPEKLVTFSSHSMSLQTLADVGYWPVEMLSNDASIFWKCYLRFAGAYRIVPMQITVSLDIPHEGSFRSAVAGTYCERRRWAWGIENFPIIMRGFFSVSGIPLFQKFRHAFKLLQNHIASATWAPIVLLIGWLPALFAALQAPPSIVAYNAARIQMLVLLFVIVALAIAAVLSLFHLPLSGIKRPFQKLTGYLFSWLLLPILGILLIALPALDVQARLIFGKYPHSR